MTRPQDTARNLTLALDGFLAEHRGCWRVYGEGLESGEEGGVLSLESGCGAVLALRRE